MNEKQKIKKKIKINEKALADGGKITAAAAAPNVLSSSVIKKIVSLLSAKKWYWSIIIIYVIIRPRCYRKKPCLIKI